MIRTGLWPLIGRAVSVIATLALVGIMLRLIGSIFTPMLPPAFVQALSAGWQQLYDVSGSAVPSIIASLIVGALLWIVIGRR